MTLARSFRAGAAMLLALTTPIVTTLSFWSDDLPCVVGLMAALLSLLVGQSYRRVLTAGVLLFLLYLAATVATPEIDVSWLVAFDLGALAVGASVGVVTEYRNRNVHNGVEHEANIGLSGPLKGRLFAYGLPAVVCALMSQLWFGDNSFLAKADVGPFVYSGVTDEIPWVWNHAMTGAGSASSRISMAMLVYWNEFWTAIGFSEPTAQRLFFAFLFGSIGGGCAYLAGTFVNNRFAVAAAGLVAGINAYTMMYILQPIYTLSIAFIAIIGAVIIRIIQGRPPRIAVFSLLTLPLSYIATNPPTFVLVLMALVVLSLVFALNDFKVSIRRLVRYSVRSLPLVCLVHLWWVVPFAFAMIVGDGFKIEAVTDPTRWAWSHKLASVENVMSLSAQWSWGNLQYHPYMGGMTKAGWNWMKFVLPLAAICAPLIARRQHRLVSISLLLVFLVLVFASKGVNAPFTSINLWFYDHIPSAWLFREPFPKFGLAMVLVMSCQVAIAVFGIGESLKTRSGRKPIRGLIIGGTSLLVVFSIAYPYPLWTSSVTTKSGFYPSSRVHLPDDFYRAARAIENSSSKGKVLQLPLLKYHQVRTSWNFYGTDNVLQRLVERPVIKPEPSGYFSAANSFADLAEKTEQAIAASNYSEAKRLVDALGVSHIVVRTDFIPADGPNENIISPQLLQSKLVGSPMVSESDAFGSYLHVFEVATPRGIVQTHGSARLAANQGPLPDVVATESQKVIVSAVDSPELPVDTKPPSVTYKQISPAEYDIQLASSPTPYILMLGESFSPRWELSGLPSNLSAKHVMADGYANSWLIPPHDQPLSLNAKYGPAQAIHLLTVLSAAFIGAVLLWVALTPAIRRLRRVAVG